jgi:hypothetical protein
MIWLVISVYAVLGLLLVVGLCRAASGAGMGDLQPRRSAPAPLVDLTQAVADDEHAERGA